MWFVAEDVTVVGWGIRLLGICMVGRRVGSMLLSDVDFLRGQFCDLCRSPCYICLSFF